MIIFLSLLPFFNPPSSNISHPFYFHRPPPPNPPPPPPVSGSSLGWAVKACPSESLYVILPTVSSRPSSITFTASAHPPIPTPLSVSVTPLSLPKPRSCIPSALTRRIPLVESQQPPAVVHEGSVACKQWGAATSACVQKLNAV